MKKNKLVVVILAGIFAFASLPVFGQTASDYMNQAIQQVRAKNYTESERLFGECIRVDPKNLECLYRRGLVRKIHIGYGLALEDFNAALAISPNNYILLTARGSLFRSLKRPDEGLVDLNKAIQLKPDYAEAYSDRADIYREKGNADMAIADYGQAVRFDPKDYISYMWRASLYDKKGEKDKAIADYSSAIAAAPSKGGNYYYRGKIYFDQGKADMAEADFKRAVELDPTLTTLVNSTRTSAALKKTLAALDAKAKPKTPAEAARSVGVSHYYKKEWDPAIVEFTKAIELEPTNHWGYIYRGRAYEGKGEYDKALADLSKGMSMVSPAEASDFLRERAEVYFKQGKTALALNEINKIIAGETKPNEYSLLLRGKIYAKMGNKVQARADLEKAVQMNQYLKAAQEELAKL
jgi:tetratricopeptide (TPR) repeat protein